MVDLEGLKMSLQRLIRLSFLAETAIRSFGSLAAYLVEALCREQLFSQHHHQFINLRGIRIMIIWLASKMAATVIMVYPLKLTKFNTRLKRITT